MPQTRKERILEYFEYGGQTKKEKKGKKGPLDKYLINGPPNIMQQSNNHGVSAWHWRGSGFGSAVAAVALARGWWRWWWQQHGGGGGGSVAVVAATGQWRWRRRWQRNSRAVAVGSAAAGRRQ